MVVDLTSPRKKKKNQQQLKPNQTENRVVNPHSFLVLLFGSVQQVLVLSYKVVTLANAQVAPFWSSTKHSCGSGRASQWPVLVNDDWNFCQQLAAFWAPPGKSSFFLTFVYPCHGVINCGLFRHWMFSELTSLYSVWETANIFRQSRKK